MPPSLRPAPRVALARLVRAYLSMRHRNSTVSGCPLPVWPVRVAHPPKPARERSFLGFERLTATVAHLLEALGTVDARATARIVIAEMMGALSLARVTRDDGEAEALLDMTALKALECVRSRHLSHLHLSECIFRAPLLRGGATTRQQQCGSCVGDHVVSIVSFQSKKPFSRDSRFRTMKAWTIIEPAEQYRGAEQIRRYVRENSIGDKDKYFRSVCTV
jgi:hypothetical protein